MPALPTNTYVLLYFYFSFILYICTGCIEKHTETGTTTPTNGWENFIVSLLFSFFYCHIPLVSHGCGYGSSYCNMNTYYAYAYKSASSSNNSWMRRRCEGKREKRSEKIWKGSERSPSRYVPIKLTQRNILHVLHTYRCRGLSAFKCVRICMSVLERVSDGVRLIE